MENKQRNIGITILFLFFLVDCSNINTNVDKVVECRLYWASDTYPQEIEEAKESDTRFIRIHYLIINNMQEECFLPIKRTSVFKDDSLYCSEICANIDNKPIYSWFSTDIRWKGTLKPNDSIHAELKIPEWILDSAKINKKIPLPKLLNLLNLKYYRCLSDTFFSSLRIPKLSFTKNDTMAVHYKNFTDRISNGILCP